MKLDGMEFTAGELYVLAGFLGYNTIFGIEQQTALRWAENVKTHVRQTVSRLEKRGILRCDLDGQVYMHPTVMRAMHCIGGAETVAMVFGNVRGGKYAAAYMLGHREQTAVLSRMADSRYRISLQDDFAVEGLLPKVRDKKNTNIHEMLLLEQAEQIKTDFIQFREDEAKECLRLCVKPDSVSAVGEVLSGNARFIGVQIYKKARGLYSMIHSDLVTVGKQGVLRVKLDKQNVLTIDSAELTGFGRKMEWAVRGG